MDKNTAHRDQISQVIQDAMDLVSALGERHLWVDTLCIVQDDEETKHDLISKIDVIYAGAVAVIVTLVCKDSNPDIPGVRRRTRILRPAAGRMVLSGSRKTHPSTSRLRILHTKAERGHSSTGCCLECVFISQGQRYISNAARGYGQKPANSKMKHSFGV